MFQKWKSNSRLMALIYIVAGIVLIVAPSAPVRILCLILGIILIVQGIIRLASSGSENGRGSSVFFAVLLLAVGFLLVFSPTFVISLLPVMIGIYLLITGVSEIVGVFAIKKGGGMWVGAAVMAVLMTLVGLVMLFNPFGSLQLALRIAGVALLVDGISTMFFTTR